MKKLIILLIALFALAAVSFLAWKGAQEPISTEDTAEDTVEADVKVRTICGTLDEPTTGMPELDLSEWQGDPWITASVMRGTGVNVEQLYQIKLNNDCAYVATTVDPYEVQQIFCQRLGYTIDGEEITLYLDQEPVYTAMNTVTDMGGFDYDAIWVGEQISYDLSGQQPHVRVTPGVKFVVGLVLHYDDMPTFTAAVTMHDGTFDLSDIKIEQEKYD